MCCCGNVGIRLGPHSLGTLMPMNAPQEHGRLFVRQHTFQFASSEPDRLSLQNDSGHIHTTLPWQSGHAHKGRRCKLSGTAAAAAAAALPWPQSRDAGMLAHCRAGWSSAQSVGMPLACPPVRGGQRCAARKRMQRPATCVRAHLCPGGGRFNSASWAAGPGVPWSACGPVPPAGCASVPTNSWRTERSSAERQYSVRQQGAHIAGSTWTAAVRRRCDA